MMKSYSMMNMAMCMCMQSGYMCMACCTSVSDMFSASKADQCVAQIDADNIALDRETYRKLPVYYFIRQVYPMQKIFEELVRENFRFGRMCCS